MDSKLDWKRVLKPVCEVHNFTADIGGGGVYIGEDGLIVTCDHLLIGAINENGVLNNVGVKLAGEDGETVANWVAARLLIHWPSVDLAILSIDFNQEKSSYVDIPMSIDLTWGSEVWAITAHTRELSIFDAIVCYPHSPESKMPDFADELTGGFGLSILGEPVPVSLEIAKCTPRGSVSAMNFHPNLPLIKVQGCALEDGASGCPIFLKKDLTFLGILSFAGSACGYYIPSPLIAKLNSVREKNEGNLWLSKGNRPKAMECYSKSIVMYPNAAAFANRASLYLHEEKHPEVENDCTESLKLDATNFKVYYRRAVAREKLGNLKEALEDAELGLKLSPNNKPLQKLRDEIRRRFDGIQDVKA